MNAAKEKLDQLIQKISRYKVEPLFSNALKLRLKNKPPDTLNENDLLRIFVRLIAYSQQAQSASVKKIIDQKIFDEVLEGYSIEKVAKMNPCDIVDKHWEKIKGIRQQTKIFQIVMFARAIMRNNKILILLLQPPIPNKIRSIIDIDNFWIGFRELQRSLKAAKVPFLRETTTLLHFLLDTGYDCIKPDSAVIKASILIGIIEKNAIKKEMEIVRFFQTYALERDLKTSAIDLYLIIAGGQTEAALFVEREFYSKIKN